jgi:hypothetical protein
MLIPFGVLSASAFAPAAEGDYELISTEILGATATSVTFSSLDTYASTYKHLQIRIAATSAADARNGFMRFNGDTASNYSSHQLLGAGEVSSAALTSVSYMNLFYISSSAVGLAVVDIVDAFSTTKNKTTRTLQGATAAATLRISLASGSWRNTTGLTSIFIGANIANGADTFAIGSRFSLYGIRG